MFSGYLEDNNCHEAAVKFLEQCPHLSECLSLHNDGKRFKTRVDGYSLQNLLDEYCEVRTLGMYVCFYRLIKYDFTLSTFSQ